MLNNLRADEIDMPVRQALVEERASIDRKGLLFSRSNPARQFVCSPRGLTAGVLLISALFLYLQLFRLPNIPRYPSGDQSIYLNHAARMVDGDLIYRDYDHFTPPGTDLVYAALFRIFGVRTWIPQVMLIAIGLLMAHLGIGIAKKVLSGSSVYLPALLFLTLPYSSYRDASHHWYSTVASTAALAVVLKTRSSARIASAGALWGVATFFTQSVALGVVGMALFLVWEWRQRRESTRDLLKKEGMLFVSVMATFAALSAYFLLRVGVRRFLYFTVVFVAKYYPADSFNNWRVYMTDHPRFTDWMGWPNLVSFLFIQLLLPSIYILFYVRYRKERRRCSVAPSPSLVLIAFVGFFLFLTVVPAPAFSRLATVSFPGLILLVWLLQPSLRVERALHCFAWCTVIVVAIARPVIEQVRPVQLLNMPTGRTAFSEPILFEKCRWAAQRSAPGDFFFGDQNIAFSLRLRNAGRVSFLRPTDYTRPEEVQDLIASLELHHVKLVSWYAGLDREGLFHPAGDHLDPIRTYLSEHYRVAKVFANGDQIRIRNK